MTIVGCKPTLGSEEVAMENQSEESLTVLDYFPFVEDRLYDYEGIGNEFAVKQVYFEFIEDNKAQLKTLNPATNTIRILEYVDSQLRETYFEGEFYHIENMLDVQEKYSNIILKEPLNVGTSWEIIEGYNRTISGLDVEVKTPMDTFLALEVTTDYGQGKTLKEYYAKDIGLVASVYEDDDFKVESLLKGIEEGPLVFDIEAYYPLHSDIELVYLKDKLEFYTNANIEKLLEEMLKNPASENLISPIPEAALINWIKLDRSSWTLAVDFSKELLSDMNVGSSMETVILDSIVNTLGRFYDVEKVYISLEGRPYESGHYALNENEFFTVDIKDVREYK